MQTEPQPAIQPSANRSEASLDARMNLESAVQRACAVICLLSAKLSEVLERSDYEGALSGTITMGVLVLADEAVEKLEGAYDTNNRHYLEAVHGGGPRQPKS